MVQIVYFIKGDIYMYRIGVDLGGTNIVVGIVDNNYNIIDKLSFKTLPSRGADAVADDIIRLCLEICAKHSVNIKEVDCIGVASPGTVNCDTGVIEYSNNIPFSNYPMAEKIIKATGCKNVYLGNDANIAAWGEAIAGAAKGTRNSVMITLGTGVGGGIVIDNKIYTGSNFAGAELGHMVIEFNGVPCSCGRRGCWESYSSATALIRMTEEKIAECKRYSIETKMIDLAESKGGVNGATAFIAYKKGDAMAREVVDIYIKYLACGLVNVVNIFQPEIVCIGGGISNEGQALIDILEPYIAADRYGCADIKQTKIRIAQLGNDAGVIGAAFLK